ncbi:hypothetical protein RA086_05520 [Lactiplantibacillus sp. WILCCON 0030]|uniref:Uncharacterized protein n=1 Tax=Lactiplantibacillus brownii TaxID=3069269 RepID=A0ABU1A813_9LACO|nr:hypothetical protein [Lactiplantibacillus brownii]MDQ7937086.1 hypothetical protein [Lactiplantibacillus brownii]
MLSVNVSDLITLLEQQDPDSPVVVLDSRTNSVLWLDEFDGKVVDEKDGIVRIMGS